MKLYNYDSKHQSINGELDLGDITDVESAIVDKLIYFLDEAGFTSRYNGLVLAKSYVIGYDEFPEIFFDPETIAPSKLKKGMEIVITGGSYVRIKATVTDITTLNIGLAVCDDFIWINLNEIETIYLVNLP